MSDIICSKCKCLVGRHKLENGQCINVDRCMEMVKYEQKDIIQNHNINILNNRYFDEHKR